MASTPAPADPIDTHPGIHLSGEVLMGLRHLARRGVSPTTRTLAGLPGGIVTRRRGRGSEPDDVRLWSEGDDRRHIDRNATARTGILHVRTHHDERDRAVVLLADIRPSMLFGTRRALRSVAAAEALVLLGWRIVGDGGRVGLVVASGAEPVVVRPAGGERAMTAVTGALAQAHAAALSLPQSDDRPLTPLLTLAQSLLPSGGHLVIASALDDPGEDFDRLLTVLAERLSISLILVSDAFERSRPPGFYPFATQDGRRGTVQAARRATAGRSTAEERLAEFARRGIEGLRLDVEAGPEAYAPLMERLDAVL
ncbi:DUF58 domain-containing protein [Methylobacterium sp. Leaf108]|uniref:DUF58 domain-containing protein n=1 Tax=Methylobacterium sp. Leaf108 TaxID=1736256 RepID=UPI0006F7C7E6|nr:DUF58 domain-containing protein [Methylobacterium sp. Leaf108]KQP55162.1 hypothetical protein ASF39_05430 [Methylobacterium sp. Leaf108]